MTTLTCYPDHMAGFAFCTTTTTTTTPTPSPPPTMAAHLLKAHPLELRPARAIQRSPWPSICKDWMFCVDPSRIQGPEDERVEEEWEYQVGWKSVLSHLFASPGILTSCVKATDQRESHIVVDTVLPNDPGLLSLLFCFRGLQHPVDPSTMGDMELYRDLDLRIRNKFEEVQQAFYPGAWAKGFMKTYTYLYAISSCRWRFTIYRYNTKTRVVDQLCDDVECAEDRRYITNLSPQWGYYLPSEQGYRILGAVAKQIYMQLDMGRKASPVSPTRSYKAIPLEQFSLDDLKFGPIGAGLLAPESLCLQVQRARKMSQVSRRDRRRESQI